MKRVEIKEEPELFRQNIVPPQYRGDVYEAPKRSPYEGLKGSPHGSESGYMGSPQSSGSPGYTTSVDSIDQVNRGIHLFIHSFVYFFIHLSVHSFILSFMYLFILSALLLFVIHPLAHEFIIGIHKFIHVPFIFNFNDSFYSFIYLYDCFLSLYNIYLI